MNDGDQFGTLKLESPITMDRWSYPGRQRDPPTAESNGPTSTRHQVPGGDKRNTICIMDTEKKKTIVNEDLSSSSTLSLQLEPSSTSSPSVPSITDMSGNSDVFLCKDVKDDGDGSNIVDETLNFTIETNARFSGYSDDDTNDQDASIVDTNRIPVDESADFKISRLESETKTETEEEKGHNSGENCHTNGIEQSNEYEDEEMADKVLLEQVAQIPKEDSAYSYPGEISFTAPSDSGPNGIFIPLDNPENLTSDATLRPLIDQGNFEGCYDTDIKSKDNDQFNTIKDADFETHAKDNECHDEVENVDYLRRKSPPDTNETTSEKNDYLVKNTPTHKREVVILDLNALLVDIDKVRLSRLSDISEENVQMESLNDDGDTYACVENPVVLDADESEITPEENSSDKSRMSFENEKVSEPSRMERSGSDDAVSGDESSSRSSQYVSTKAVIENSPVEETINSQQDGDRIQNNKFPVTDAANCLNGDNLDRESIHTITDSETKDEGRNLLPPKADLDSMDLIVEEDENCPRPEPQGSDSTEGLLTTNTGDNSGMQKVAQIFRQNQYKTFSKKRVVYSTIIKYILFFFNFICWFFSKFCSIVALSGIEIAGVAAAAAGYWMIAEKHKVVRDALDFFLDPAIILCVTGVIIFIVAFFGFVGALRENIVLLKIWHISLSVFLVGELIFGILVFLFYFFPGIRRGLNLAPEDWGLKEAIRKYKDDSGMRDWIDMVQREMKCCGVTNSDQGYKDWQQNKYYNCSKLNPSPEKCSVPPSCCIIEPGDYYNIMCGYNTNNKEVWQVETDIYTQGCVQGFGKWLQRHAVIIGAVFTGVVVPQFIGIVLARIYIKLTNLKQARSRWKKWKLRLSRKTETEPTDV